MVDLRENEAKTMLALGDSEGFRTVSEIVEVTGLAHAAVMRAALSLEAKNLVKVQEKKTQILALTEEGGKYAEGRLPERRLLNALGMMGGEASVNAVLEAASLDKSLTVIALGWLSRKGWARIEKRNQRLKSLGEQPEGVDEKLLSMLKEHGTMVAEDLPQELRASVPILRGRNLLAVSEEAERKLELTKAGWDMIKRGIGVIEEVSQLTPEHVAAGKWREVKLLRYNIEAPVARTWPGKRHPYLRFLDDLKWRLIALGFKEMIGPNVELSFFNCDSLYMPQDHPAREVHDMYFVKEPEYGNLDQYRQFLAKVKKTHENGWKIGSRGWGYTFPMLEAARLMLRSQTTSVSARTMISKELEIPGKYFAIARCFRPDVVDKTHLPEFFQVEGIVLDEDLTLRDLLGVLERFAKDVAGADKVRFRPDYFPFTEPSVELVAYREGYGWLEFGGSGLFRPEVTLPLGISVPVLAWGLGVERLFMMKARIDDIRYLFSQDLDWLRRMEVI